MTTATMLATQQPALEAGIPLPEALALGLLGLAAIMIFVQALREWKKGRSVDGRIQQMAKRAWATEREEALSLLRKTHQSMSTGGSFWEDLRVAFQQAGLDWSPRRVSMWLLAAAIGGSVLGYLWAGGAGMVMGAIVVVAAFWAFVKRRQRKRQEAFEQHFPEALELMARSLQAGHAFTAGLQAVGQEASWPVNEEFQRVFEEQKFGLPLPDAMMGLSDRNDLMDVKLFVTSVLIQRETGGNLVELLEGLVETIRERFSFRRELKVHTAHGRITGLILVLAPAIVALGLWLLNPGYLSRLWTEPMGQLMLLVAVGMQILGFLWIRRIVDIQL